MASVLADTSAWIDYFQGRKNETWCTAFRDLLTRGQLLVCGVIEAELLQGMRPEEMSIVLAALEACTFLDLNRDDFRHAGNLMAEARKRGERPNLADSLIASACIRRKTRLLCSDGDFDRIPALKPFRMTL